MPETLVSATSARLQRLEVEEVDAGAETLDPLEVVGGLEQVVGEAARDDNLGIGAPSSIASPSAAWTRSIPGSRSRMAARRCSAPPAITYGGTRTVTPRRPRA
jgi:hypothetical protein